jgi:hypothetical protein
LKDDCPVLRVFCLLECQYRTYRIALSWMLRTVVWFDFFPQTTPLNFTLFVKPPYSHINFLVFFCFFCLFVASPLGQRSYCRWYVSWKFGAPFETGRFCEES